MKQLEKRFKIVALAIINNPNCAILEDKLSTVADAIDSNAPVAKDMVKYLEDSLLKIADYMAESENHE